MTTSVIAILMHRITRQSGLLGWGAFAVLSQPNYWGTCPPSPPPVSVPVRFTPPDDVTYCEVASGDVKWQDYPRFNSPTFPDHFGCSLITWDMIT